MYISKHIYIYMYKCRSFEFNPNIFIPVILDTHPRLKNYWAIHALVKFDAFKMRKPSRAELQIIIDSFNEEFEAPICFKSCLNYHSLGWNATIIHSIALGPLPQNLAIRDTDESVPRQQQCWAGSSWLWRNPWAMGKQVLFIKVHQYCSPKVQKKGYVYIR